MKQSNQPASFPEISISHRLQIRHKFDGFLVFFIETFLFDLETRWKHDAKNVLVAMIS